MRFFALFAVVALAAPLAACSSSGGSTCDRAVANTISILKKEMPDAPAGDRADMMAKCKAQPAAAQACAADAKDLAGLMACGH
jgi:hypothetical protein